MTNTVLPAKRDKLATTAYLCIILATMGYAAETVREHLAVAAASAKSPTQVGKIENQAYTNAHAAHFTFTNLNDFSVSTCVRGLVERKSPPGQAETVPVCTGEMKPRTTVVLEAPYSVGVIETLCSGAPDRFGNTHLDWDRCNFTAVPVATR